MSKLAAIDEIVHGSNLPVADCLEVLTERLEQDGAAVLIAPPGAGKTTLVPLALLDAPWRNGRKLIVLEPRRLAARASAARMAALLGEAVGKTVGYRVRFESRVSTETKIEVVTEGVFTRMLTSDPALEEVAAVLFDEFHERSLDLDLALTLCLDLKSGLREDLRLLPMSATLEGDKLADMLSCSVVTSSGRQFPVATSYRERPVRREIEAFAAETIHAEILSSQEGTLLVFLPGQREIERVFGLLSRKLPSDVTLLRLYGSLSPAEQDKALSALGRGEKRIVLSSAIAETSLTLPGVHTVIDSGLARQARYDPATGLSRLETVRAPQSSIDQRRGRAGRLGPGKTIRLWRKEQTAALPKRPPPEIFNADLTRLLLDLAEWGVNGPSDLNWLDNPPDALISEAGKFLRMIGAFDDRDRLTGHGKAVHAISLPPNLAHMVVLAAASGMGNAEKAARLALLFQERGAIASITDLNERLVRSEQANSHKRLRNLAERIARQAVILAGSTTAAENQSSGRLLATAFPDRIARRTGQSANGNIRYRMANGSAGELDPALALANENWIVIADLIGPAGRARITAASAISLSEIEEAFAGQITDEVSTTFDVERGSFLAVSERRLGTLQLAQPTRIPTDNIDFEGALVGAIRDNGLEILPWSPEDRLLKNRLNYLQSKLGSPWPDVTDKALLAELETWLAPFLTGQRSLKGLGKGKLSDALSFYATQSGAGLLDAAAPARWNWGNGHSSKIDYAGDVPLIRVRPQWIYGCSIHPKLDSTSEAIELHLLSPAERTIQITRDLAGFWKGSWDDVRRDMRGRYPKHDWPDDPIAAKPVVRGRR